MSKLQCIRLKAEQHLHHPLSIGLNDGITTHGWNGEIYVVVMGLATLDHDNFLDGIQDVEIVDVFSEVSRLYLSKVKKVLNDESQKVDRRVLNFKTVY